MSDFDNECNKTLNLNFKLCNYFSKLPGYIQMLSYNSTSSYNEEYCKILTNNVEICDKLIDILQSNEENQKVCEPYLNTFNKNLCSMITLITQSYKNAKQLYIFFSVTFPFGIITIINPLVLTFLHTFDIISDNYPKNLDPIVIIPSIIIGLALAKWFDPPKADIEYQNYKKILSNKAYEELSSICI